MEIIGWNKKMVYIGECDCGAIIKAKKTELNWEYDDYDDIYTYYERCPECGNNVRFKEKNEKDQ